MQSTLTTLDRWIGRILLVKPPEPAADEQPAGGAERAFGFSLAFSGIRCIVQYVILPFILPLIGIAGDFAAYITLVVNVIAIGALIFSVRRFWAINYKGKWTYLAIAGPALIILIAFLVLDIQAIV